MAKRILLIIAAGWTMVVPQASAQAQGVPGSIAYQGKLTDAAGQPLPDNAYQVQFRLYTVQSGGTAFWTSQCRASRPQEGCSQPRSVPSRRPTCRGRRMCGWKPGLPCRLPSSRLCHRG